MGLRKRLPKPRFGVVGWGRTNQRRRPGGSSTAVLYHFSLHCVNEHHHHHGLYSPGKINHIRSIFTRKPGFKCLVPGDRLSTERRRERTGRLRHCTALTLVIGASSIGCIVWCVVTLLCTSSSPSPPLTAPPHSWPSSLRRPFGIATNLRHGVSRAQSSSIFSAAGTSLPSVPLE